MDEAKKLKKDEAIKREMSRESQDEIRVANPTKEDIIVRYDGREFPVPGQDKDIGYGKGQAVYPRYIAKKYAYEMTIKRIHAANDVELAEEKKKAVKDPHVHWPEIEETLAKRTDNPEVQKKYSKGLIVGLERRFGGDDSFSEDKPRDTRPESDKLFDSIMSEEIVDSKEKLLDQIADEE